MQLDNHWNLHIRILKFPFPNSLSKGLAKGLSGKEFFIDACKAYLNFLLFLLLYCLAVKHAFISIFAFNIIAGVTFPQNRFGIIIRIEFKFMACLQYNQTLSTYTKGSKTAREMLLVEMCCISF